MIVSCGRPAHSSPRCGTDTLSFNGERMQKLTLQTRQTGTKKGWFSGLEDAPGRLWPGVRQIGWREIWIMTEGSPDSSAQ
jgi:hypothetical protein